MRGIYSALCLFLLGSCAARAVGPGVVSPQRRIDGPARDTARPESCLAAWIVNSASLRPGPLAPSSMATAFGENLAPGSAGGAEGYTLPRSLAGTRIEVTDSANVTHASALFLVSPEQVNFQIPADAAAGPATVTIRNRNGGEVSGRILIDPTAPGLFAANESGEGAGLIGVVHDAARVPTPAYGFDLVLRRFVSVPIAFNGREDRLYLVLYGTGVRGLHNRPDVTVHVGGEPVPVAQVDAADDCPGLDKVKIGPLPQVLAGRGEVPVELFVGGRVSNRVTVHFE
jgi:uncharacterized protein (TIGR03437 family)